VVPKPAEPAKPDPTSVATTQLEAALDALARWASTHAGAPCPTPDALGLAKDPWAHPLRVTCTQQPADQLAGVTSAGPDGAFGTADDVVSWRLADAAKKVHGSRWAQAQTAPPRDVTVKPSGAKAGSTAAKSAIVDPFDASKPKPAQKPVQKPAQPLQLDADGLPITR
jgi:hypothetical protein